MFNFRKISAIGASALMVGMTAGIAGAANYPQPFVVGGSANVAVVYGTGSGVSVLDAVEAGNLQSNLQSFMGAGTGATSTSTSGETISLDTSGTRIWLNTSLNTAKSTLTKSDLPNVLGDSTFQGNVEAKMTSNLKFFAGAAAGGTNSGRVIFAKQPKSNTDPSLGISLGTSSINTALYNASVTFKAVNFTHSDSEGESISLFGKDYVVSTATSTTDLVLFSSAEEITLTKTGESTPSATVSVSGTDYTVELLNGDATTATIAVDGVSKDITEGNSKKIGVIEVAVKTVTSSNAAGITATLLVGSEKLTFVAGSTVARGSDEDPVDGTFVYMTGGTGAMTELAVSVFRPGSSNDAILPGDAFVDPVFGSFKFDFVGLSSNLDDTNRETISVLTSGDDAMTLTMTDQDGESGTFTFAYNVSGAWNLSDDNAKQINVVEMRNVTQDQYVVLGNEDYGHLLELIRVQNNTGTDATKDAVDLQDVLSGTVYKTTFTSEGHGTVAIDGKTYTVSFIGDGETGVARFKYPTGDSADANTMVLFPTIGTAGGAQIILYEPTNFSLGNLSLIGTSTTGYADNEVTTTNIPDGDGYTSITNAFLLTADQNTTWTIGGIPVNTSAAVDTNSTGAITVGQLTYNFTSAGTNHTKVYLIDPESNNNIDQPAVIILEGKDDKNEYHAVVVDLETAPNADSDSGVGVNDVRYSSDYGLYKNLARSSDSKFTEDFDWWGTHVVSDATDSDQTIVTISYPTNQVYSQIFVGEVGSTVSSTTSSSSASQLGDVLVKDTEVSSVNTKNLIIVGGTCINSVAANVLGGAYCGADWTTATGVGSGQFLIEALSNPSATDKVALVVAGYEVADTVNAAKYLRTQTVDTAVGTKYKGTTSTSAELVVE